MKQEIRKLLGLDQLIIGTERSLKALRAGALSKIILASNCSDEMRAAVDSAKGKAEVVVAKENNDELGVLCKKPFRIAIVGVKA